MAESSYVTDVTGADFAQRVVEKSREVPVLVDFWAPWCGPGRMLAPILARVAADYAGKLNVAKVNTDVEQALALEFGIRGIPAIKLFRHGKVVGEFVGVQPESVIRATVEPFLPNEVDAAIERSTGLVRDGRTAEAVALLRESHTSNPRDDRIKIELAKLLAALPSGQNDRARLEECDALLDSLSVRSDASTDVGQLRARLALLRAVIDAPPVTELKEALQNDAGDNAARFQLAARLALAGDYETAMNQLLEIVRRDRSYGDDAARKTLIGLFGLLGNQHPLSIEYRALLSRALN